MALVLREEEVRNLLSMPDTVAVMEQAFGALADGNVVNLPRSRIRLANGVLNMLAAAAQPSAFSAINHTRHFGKECVLW